MNGPDHFREAERLIANASRELDAASSDEFEDARVGAALGFAAAQVHATLAVAAAQLASVPWTKPFTP